MSYNQRTQEGLPEVCSSRARNWKQVCVDDLSLASQKAQPLAQEPHRLNTHAHSPMCAHIPLGGL